MRGHVIGLTLALATSACSSPARTPATEVADKDVKKATAKHARGVVKELYRSVRRGRGSNMQTLLADHAFVAGPLAGDLFAARGAAIIAATDRFEMANRHRVRSRGLVTMSSPSGRAAWIADRVEIDRAPHTLVAVLAQVDDIWYAVAVHLGRQRGGAAPESLPPLTGGVDGGAEEVVELVRAGAADPAQFVEQLAEHRNVTVLGSGKRDHARGAKRIARLWKKRKAAKKPLEIDGDMRAGVTPDGSLAWVIANVRVADAPPRRVFWIYEQDSADTTGGWRLVLMQSATPRA